MRANCFDGGRDVGFHGLFRWLHMGVDARLARRTETAFVSLACDGYHHFHHEAGIACQHFFHFLEHVLQFRSIFTGVGFVFHIPLFLLQFPTTCGKGVLLDVV